MRSGRVEIRKNRPRGPLLGLLSLHYRAVYYSSLLDYRYRVGGGGGQSNNGKTTGTGARTGRDECLGGRDLGRMGILRRNPPRTMDAVLSRLERKKNTII